jgi:cytochrome bd-type quinol oxidase subunit 2
MEQLMVIIEKSSTGDAALSFLGWFGFFVIPILVIYSIYFGFQNRKTVAPEPLENEEMFDHLFELKKNKNLFQ